VPHKLQNPSRRAFARSLAACAFGTAIFLGLRPKLAAAQDNNKMTQQAVQYQDKPKGAQQCDKCSLFQAPKACQSVSGDISPHGWCAIFMPKS